MFERILVPLDGSPRAEVILAQLGPILRRQDAEVLLTRALLHDPGDSLWARGTDLARVTRELRDEAVAYLRRTADRLSAEGVRARACHPEGPLPEAILEAARKEHATLIAMTTHGRTGLARWIPGSVAEKVVRASEIPVLLVPSFPRGPRGERTPALAKEIRFDRILVPVDGSEFSLAIIPAATEFARLFEAEVTVVCVDSPTLLPMIPGVDSLDDLLVPIETRSLPTVECFRKSGVRVSSACLWGDPASQIVDYSASKGMNLITMATHGRSGVARWFMGSVAERVLHSSGVPLLLVRPPSDPRA